MPHMVTIASLVVLVAGASAIAGWVAAGSEMISYAGLQIAFAFFYSVFQGYAPDTDLDNVRNRVVGILFGLIVTGLVFRYIWPERTIDRLRAALRAALQQLARLLEIPRPEIPLEKARAEAHDLIPETSKTFEQARRYAELTTFELEESPNRDRTSLGNLEETLSRAEDVFDVATSLVSDEALASWQQLPTAAQIAESDLRAVAAKRVERAATGDVVENTETEFSEALHVWNEIVQQSHSENSRSAAVSQIASGVQHLE
jgi:multidrug resistance protein MdtO